MRFLLCGECRKARRSEADSSFKPGGVTGRKAGQQPGGELAHRMAFGCFLLCGECRKARRSEANSSFKPGGAACRKAGQQPERELAYPHGFGHFLLCGECRKATQPFQGEVFSSLTRRVQSRRSEADSSFQPGGVAGRKTGRRLRLCGGLFSVRKDHVRLSLPDAD